MSSTTDELDDGGALDDFFCSSSSEKYVWLPCSRKTLKLEETQKRLQRSAGRRGTGRGDEGVARLGVAAVKGIRRSGRSGKSVDDEGAEIISRVGRDVCKFP